MHKGQSLLYSSGNFAASLALSAFSTYVIFYYVDVLKMPAQLAGFAMALSGIWNALNNPLFGQISDRTRAKKGRRLPYIRYGSLPFIIVFFLVWTPPLQWLGSNPMNLFIYFVAIIFVFDTLYTLVILNWTALFPEMYQTQEERTKVSAYRQSFGIIGNIIGIAIPPILYSSIGWTGMGISFSVLTLISLGTSLLGSHEDPAYRRNEGLPLWTAIKATYGNRSFLTYVLGAMFLQFTFVMLEAGFPFYAKYVLKVNGLKVSLMLGIIFIIALFFVNFWATRAIKAGSKKTIILCSVLYGLALIPFWFVTGFIGAVLTPALIGFGLAGLMILLDVMLSDTVDEDELRTGARREGMYFGINGFMVRLSITFQAVIMGTILSRSGYNPNLPIEAQPALAIAGIKSLITIIPIIALIVAIVFFGKYPLDGQKLKEVKEKIKLLHD